MKLFDCCLVGKLRFLLAGISITPSICRFVIAPSLLIDVGCGKGNFLHDLKRWGNYFRVHQTYKIGLDIFDPSLRQAKQVYDEVVKCNVKNIPFRDNIFDVAVCFQVIEHLQKSEGFILLNELERISSGKIILTAPVGSSPKHKLEDKNPWQAHVSSWYPCEFVSRGCLVRGFHGVRLAKGMEDSYLWSKFEYLLLIFDMISGLLVYCLPSAARQMMCVIDKRDIPRKRFALSTRLKSLATEPKPNPTYA